MKRSILGEPTETLSQIRNKNVALITVLRHKFTNQVIVFGNIHILHNQQRGELKLA